MKCTAKRTLVKSAPELWELADDLGRMESWLGEVAGGSAAEVEVTERLREQALAWRSDEAAIELELAKGTFGTAVSLTADMEHRGAGNPDATVAALERLLDELGSPERRPFTRG